MSTIIILTLLLTLVHVIVAQISLRPELPVITTENEDDEFLDGNSSVIVRPTGYFDFKCQSTYPIFWDWDGDWDGTILSVREERRDIASSSAKINATSGFLYSSVIWSVVPDNVSIIGSLICRRVEDLRLSTRISIFISGSNSKAGPRVYTTGIQNGIVPCPSSNPKATVYLVRTDLQGRTIRLPSMYNPLRGFLLSDLTPGTYTCVDVSSKKNQSFIIYPNEILASPNTTEIKGIEGEEITFLCESQTPIRVTFSPWNLNYTETNPSETSIQIVLRVPKYSDAIGTPVIVQCLQTADSQVSHRWNIGILERPWISFNREDGEIDCVSNDMDRSIATLRCLSPNDCQLKKKCFTDKSCDNGDFYFPGKHNVALRRIEDDLFNVSSIRPSHRYGLVQCIVGGDQFIAFEFFSGFSLILRSDMKSAALSEILRLDELPRILYTNETQYFYCEAHQFIFDDGMKFALKYKNGSLKILHEGMYEEDQSPKTTERVVFEYNKVMAINTKVDIDVSEVFCFAPVRSGYDWMNVSRSFEMRHLSKPVILSHDANHIFIKDAKQQRLSCETSGDPKPEIKWLRIGTDLSSDFKISSTITGESFLDFPPITFEHEGMYVCVAENKNGKSEKTFFVKIEEPSSTNTILIVVVICTVLGILVLSALLLQAWRRHRITTALLRDLTDKEINEFLNGVPDHLHLNNSEANIMDQVQFMPYNASEYEIPWKDICFGDEKTEQLGAGAFGIVVKGRIKGDSEYNYDVAIKTTKPSAGVDVFKDLLSELKIMIYIEKQDNIVALLGACTENIRHRQLYIVVELCPLGNLQKYLRSNRDNFVNHLQGQEIGKRPTYENLITPRMSTVDLVNWSQQIASGLEYLQSKKVVHGDLAARNILLTEDKIAKITDFGLSRRMYDNINYVKKTKSPLPWRWMALESMQFLEFSSKSDIWGYGVVLYEIYSLGEMPWIGETQWGQEFVTKVSKGERMGRPPFASEQIYDVMMQCWDANPDKRPPFKTLKDYFASVCEEIDVTTSSRTSSDIRV